MSSAITTLGEQLIAQYIGNQQTLVIDRFILANIAGLDPAVEVDRAEQMPDAGDIVHTYDIPADYKGYVNENQVVYSMLLGSTLGDFNFNWIGLYSSADDVVVAITYVPLTSKWQTDPSTNTLGNNLTRNFLLEFTGAQACTGITVTAATWQIDFTVRLAGMDERERMSNRDVYGRACFWNNGWQVVNDAGTFSLKAGMGYVEGIRIALAADEVITPGVLPKDVWLDVSLQTSGADVVALVGMVFSTDAQADFVDTNNFSHYLEKIAQVDAAGVVTDARRTETIEADVVAYLRGMVEAESSARSTADGTLQNNINAEAAARSSADSTLQNNINAEAAARAAADAGLLPLSGGTLTGRLTSKSSTGAVSATGPDPGVMIMGDAANAAYVSFYRAGAYAVNFGLDTDNQLKVGGWSMGSVARLIIHDGNLLNYFAQSYAGNGYVKLPNGLMFQWGNINVGDIASNDIFTATFPTAFPNSCLMALVTPAGTNFTGVACGVQSFSTTQCIIKTYEWGAFSQDAWVNFFAIGY